MRRILSTPVRGLILGSSYFIVPFAACLSGCAKPAPKPMVRDEMAAFRARAIALLESAAFGTGPAERMQAIEAFKEVAPREGLALQAIPLNIENEYPGASFAALMAAGEIGATHLAELVRTRAEHADPNVRMAAIFALHKFGDSSRTSELASYLIQHPDTKVRANAAFIIGRLGGKQHMKLLKVALRREKKDLAKLQILEALASMGDRNSTERLIFDGYSEIPQQSAIALMMLANARADAAEELFWFRMRSGKWPEVQLQAARGLARLGFPQGIGLGIKYLGYNTPQPGNPDDPPEQQIRRVRGLAALTLESIADPAALRAMQQAFDEPGQSNYVRIAIARAAIHTINTARPDLADETPPTNEPPLPAGQLAGESTGEMP